LLAEAPADAEAVLLQGFDLDVLRQRRADWFLFRDRRPETYSTLGTFDGQLRS